MNQPNSHDAKICASLHCRVRVPCTTGSCLQQRHGLGAGASLAPGGRVARMCSELAVPSLVSGLFFSLHKHS